ncbi:hypothetical protein NS274_19520 [Pseudomonas oryzihabitans]|uniref:hypothetical protein n=1 Tax=Pseudomonas rhizoryzae TaxID=2571129 RepID=UPI0007368EB8|nr:hypothetical protein [Pseudomonas rhizoryzae]APQ11626.1 hypothetical protein BJP27_08960 [Pseudomonas psychrotolerans]KTS74132.1 hypothetical protein NS274_19520 [Pseudomonas psychrotolerans]KTT02994.1 hypothetical protein NS376_11775 [Pseudomonas psychrotolerans]KTT10585.1 hypothetical protein NS2R_18060 [Pseudomonas psychrotolerans]KTT26594.1 hypothetical protein SB14R_02020 [Pseudomonas psychrotolerans]
MSLQGKVRRYWRVAVLAIGALCVVAGLIGYGKSGGGDKTTSAQESFVNKVWQIKTSNSIEPGMLYVFLSDGTLVMASPSSQPSLGRWARTEKGLNLIEEGITYPTEILSLKRDEFRIRSLNPGDPVELQLTPAAP